ncbi:HTH myb-type domain-containing protein [Pseudozyma hubeiensis]|nr:HTH myb-type domain-containing protein [Pseudozyma hubeiensis]
MTRHDAAQPSSSAIPPKSHTERTATATTTNTNASQSQPTPSTPPTASADLPTPPTSHTEFRPPPNPVASSSRINTDDQLPDASPTTTVSENMGPRRAAARLSGGSTSFDRNAADDSFSSSHRRASRRSSIDRNDERTMAAERPIDRTSYRSRTAHSPSRSPARSPTPSPILGPAYALDDHIDDHDVLKLGHLSFPMLGVGVGPTKQEIEMLVYGSSSTSTDAADPPSPADESGSLESILGSLANMGLDQPTDTSVSERERELAGMVKMLASRCTTLTESRDRAQSQLRSTRLTALSVISSMKQAHAHALAAHRNVTDRLEAELDGWKAQAKMLSALLNRAQAKGFDERRSNSTSAPVVTFADRAKAAAASGPSPTNNRVSSSKADPASTNGDTNQRLLSSPSFLSSAQDNQALASPGTTGLGISSSGLVELDADLSPTASLIRERNKLITDKKHLKARVRDAEAQVFKLESELKALRPYLVSGGIKATDLPAPIADADALGSHTPGNLSQPGTAPTTPSRSGSRRDKNRKKRNVTMGDAETEHLMLAARRLRELRKEQQAASDLTASGSSADSSSFPPSQETAKQPSNVVLGNQALAPAAELQANVVSHSSPVKRQASEEPMSADRDGPRASGPRTPPSGSAERPPKTPKSMASIPNTPRTGVRARELDELARGDDRRDSWSDRHRRVDSASSFTGIDELLQAAETLNPGAAAPSPNMRSGRPAPHFPPPGGDPTYYAREPPHRGSMGYPPPLSVATQRGPEYDPYGGYSAAPYPIQSSPLRMAHESPKRRRVSSAAFDFEPYGSPFLGERQPRIRTQTEGADPFLQGRPYHDYAPSGPPSAGGSQTLSALDLLADQATASQNPSQGSDKSGEYEGVSPIGSLSSEDEMAMDGESRRKSGSRLASSRAHDGSRSSKANGSQTSSRNGESKSFGGNQNPEKRLPYVRWTSEEDTKLRAAIKEHGQRWELISRAVGTRSYHQCRQRYLLMRRKEAAAKANGDDNDGGQGLSASASDQQSQESDYGQDPVPASSSSRRKSGPHARRASRGAGEYNDNGPTSTPLHKLSIGAPAPPGSVYGQFSPTHRQEALAPPSSQTPTHSRMMSHPHAAGPLSPSMQPTSPYSSQTPSAVRRGPYPPPSPLSMSSRQLPPLQPPPGAYMSQGPPSSPLSSGGHRRQFSGDTRPPQTGSAPQEPTTPTSGARRMGAALYS